MKNLIFLSSLIFLITACSKKDENIKTDNKHHQNSLESKYEKEILNKMQIVPFSQIKGFFDDDLNHALEVFKKDCQKSMNWVNSQEHIIRPMRFIIRFMMVILPIQITNFIKMKP